MILNILQKWAQNNGHDGTLAHRAHLVCLFESYSTQTLGHSSKV